MIDVGRLLEVLRVESKRVGANRVARCPFPDHEDRDPSFKMRDQPGNTRHALYVCSCGRGGSARTLVHDLEGISWEEVDAWLVSNGAFGDEAELEGGVIVELVGSEAKPRMRMPPEVHFRELARWPTPARRYAEKRGITAAQVERWGIGYAVDGRLRGRIVMPVRNEQGVLAGYMARAFDGAEKRYLTASREEGPDEGVMFGSERWGAERRVVVLAEGALKCLAVERACGAPVAAVGGNQLQPEHVVALSTFERVVIVPDADDAGEGVAADVYAALARWHPVVKVKLGVDADEVRTERLAAELARAGVNLSCLAHGST